MLTKFVSRKLERSEIAIAPSPRGLGRDNSNISNFDTVRNRRKTKPNNSLQLALAERRLTDALDILAAAGYYGEVAIFILSLQGEV